MLDADILSTVIFCKNEEDRIKDCIDSLLWCDEIVIIDDFSSDLTLEKIKEFNNDNVQGLHLYVPLTLIKELVIFTLFCNN